ncbi:MAG: type II toxin-antitoxin system prevent-host-death family antitoxin [Pseudoxanthomonas sp.]
MTQVNMLEAKTRLSELVKAVQAGEEVVIANRGVPVAKLVKLTVPQNRQLGDPGEILDWLKKNPPPRHSRRSREQIDADIAVERDSWD